MSTDGGDKRHAPTPHRRQEAKRKGRVAKSRDLVSAVVLVVGVLAIMTVGDRLIVSIQNAAEQSWGDEAWSLDSGQVLVERTQAAITSIIPSLSLLLGLIFVAAVGVNIVQSGFLFLPEQMAPDLKRISPKQGLQRTLSIQGSVRTGFGLIKITAAAIVGWYAFRTALPTLQALPSSTPEDAIAYVCKFLLSTSLKVGVVFILLGLIDYGFQYWRREQELMMTDQELREEMKSLEGDPQMTAKRRQVQRQLASQRLSVATPQSDVILTDGAGLAIGIRRKENEPLPLISAKGRGETGERIRDLAKENGIPIVENPELIKALDRATEVNDPIPEDCEEEIAGVLEDTRRSREKD
jgi:flagellar biosynthesis protein FlhB